MASKRRNMKRVIIKVPSKIKHVYHHHTKKVHVHKLKPKPPEVHFVHVPVYQKPKPIIKKHKEEHGGWRYKGGGDWKESPDSWEEDYSWEEEEHPRPKKSREHWHHQLPKHHHHHYGKRGKHSEMEHTWEETEEEPHLHYPGGESAETAEKGNWGDWSQELVGKPGWKHDNRDAESTRWKQKFSVPPNGFKKPQKWHREEDWQSQHEDRDLPIHVHAEDVWRQRPTDYREALKPEKTHRLTEGHHGHYNGRHRKPTREVAEAAQTTSAVSPPGNNYRWISFSSSDAAVVEPQQDTRGIGGNTRWDRPFLSDQSGHTKPEESRWSDTHSYDSPGKVHDDWGDVRSGRDTTRVSGIQTSNSHRGGNRGHFFNEQIRGGHNTRDQFRRNPTHVGDHISSGTSQRTSSYVGHHRASATKFVPGGRVHAAPLHGHIDLATLDDSGISSGATSGENFNADRSHRRINLKSHGSTSFRPSDQLLVGIGQNYKGGIIDSGADRGHIDDINSGNPYTGEVKSIDIHEVTTYQPSTTNDFPADGGGSTLYNNPKRSSVYRGSIRGHRPQRGHTQWNHVQSGNSDHDNTRNISVSTRNNISTESGSSGEYTQKVPPADVGGHFEPTRQLYSQIMNGVGDKEQERLQGNFESTRHSPFGRTTWAPPAAATSPPSTSSGGGGPKSVWQLSNAVGGKGATSYSVQVMKFGNDTKKHVVNTVHSSISEECRIIKLIIISVDVIPYEAEWVLLRSCGWLIHSLGQREAMALTSSCAETVRSPPGGI
ncbi:hypothetical protein AAG570_004539 [Ranatra chinensis]|uniref:Uncharacterized protein n=1 Tax=Ranatra chinensis TaxID=642074 RepID=A0ABD0Y158_9HEMI